MVLELNLLNIAQRTLTFLASVCAGSSDDNLEVDPDAKPVTQTLGRKKNPRKPHKRGSRAMLAD